MKKIVNLRRKDKFEENNFQYLKTEKLMNKLFPSIFKSQHRELRKKFLHLGF